MARSQQQQQEQQDLMQSWIGTQLNTILSGQLDPDAQGHFLCVGLMGSWPRILGQML
ncbi:hypothetical protein DPMN_003252 [Dreissena polymorpha]|uniref:Uncharacterized protein n=1 Tax=Dreissena polymorpha TaxID=45954 RepID=A0A9D4ML75_DREPO|nr:hypothetical protein DPMN_003252 [Dreissena polymorpha]